jgi:Uma2 family endonuclease
MPTAEGNLVSKVPRHDPPPLENGDTLHAREFMRRYAAMPHVKKAELIEGRVYMGSPVRADVHARPDGIVQTWLGSYAAATLGVALYPHATLLLDSDNTFQPDAMLCVRADRGGRSRVNDDGYVAGSPELVVEVAASSASLDARDKFRVYRRASVPEYLLWRTEDGILDWIALEGDEYVAKQPDAQGILRSSILPGLVLLKSAMFSLDAAAILRTLNEALKSPEHQEFVKRLGA